MNSYTGEAKYV